MVDVQPGDIILAASRVKGATYRLQALSRMWTFFRTSKGAASISHVMIALFEGSYIAHASVKHPPSAGHLCCELEEQHANGLIYRCYSSPFNPDTGASKEKTVPSAEERKIRRGAAAIAQTWSKEPSTPDDSHISDVSALRKYIRPGFGSSEYGKHARDRTVHFHSLRERRGGPYSSALHPRRKAMNCSAFVIACYHALGEEIARKYLHLDSAYTSPMRLHHFLNDSPFWRFEGIVDPEPEMLAWKKRVLE